jgi:predicted ester cyclase
MDDLNSIKSAAVRFYLGSFDAKDPEGVRDLASPDLVFHDAGADLEGWEAWVAFARGWIDGFPDLSLEVPFVMAEGDQVLLHWRGGGTHLGSFRTRAATGRRISASGLALLRFSEGLIAEIWDEVSAFGRLERLVVED